MLRKIHIAAIVFLLLPLFLLFGISNGFGLGSNEDNSSMVCFTPDNIAGVDVGETVTVSFILSEDVVNLYGFDIELKWDPATLEYVSHVVMAPVESYSQGVLHDPTFSLKDEVDSSAEPAGLHVLRCRLLSHSAEMAFSSPLPLRSSPRQTRTRFS